MTATSPLHTLGPSGGRLAPDVDQSTAGCLIRSASDRVRPSKRRPLAGRSQGSKVEQRKSNALIKSNHASPPSLLQNTNRARFLTHWLRTESHQTPVGIKLVAMPCDRPWRQLPPQRNFGASPCPGGVCIPCGYRHDDDTSPLMAHGLGDSAFCIRSDGARAASKSFGWLHTSLFAWLIAPGQTVIRNTGAHQRASGLAACGSTPARACAPVP